VWKFQLEHVNNLEEDFTDSFSRLPKTDHLDGKYRLRRYSVFHCDMPHLVFATHENRCLSYAKMPARSFTQSSKYNNHQGDVSRAFEDIEDATADSETMQKLLHIFSQRCLPRHMEIEVHQMRVITNEGGKLSPEGVHQDGYDRVAMLSVNRHNVTGGHLLLHKTKGGDPIVDMELDKGEIAFINDRELWHNGSPIKKIDPEEKGFMDILIMLANFNTPVEGEAV
jgi:hypothetical protein